MANPNISRAVIIAIGADRVLICCLQTVRDLYTNNQSAPIQTNVIIIPGTDE